MKIGIITFQLAWNCGAVLQCTALQRKLEGWGHEVCVINYRPDYKKNRYKKYPNLILSAMTAYKDYNHLNFNNRVIKVIKSTGRSVLNYKSTSGRLKQYRDFNEYCRKNLNLTRVYTSIKELRNNPPECDLYITGSDQLWNPKLTNKRLDEAYFLDFGKPETKRIAYAISACELDTNKYGRELKELCRGFNKISLREAEMKDKLEKILNRTINICIDPTLLLTATDYADFEYSGRLQQDKYILVYALDNPGTSDLLFKTVSKLKEKYRLPVMVISGPHKWPYEVVGYKPQDGISPGEFLSYIKNAEVVVTNSFHAVTFSVLYNKEFYAVLTPERSSRVTELLDKAGLITRIPQLKKDNVILEDTQINYNEVFRKLSYCKAESESFLKDLLERQ